MDEDLIGMIQLFGQGKVPLTYSECNGQLVSIPTNLAVYSVLGNRYGGDGIRNFALPSLTAPTGLVYAICVRGAYPVPA